MTPEERAIDAFTLWYTQVSQSDGFPAKGTIAGALVVLDALKSNFNLDIDAHTAKGGSQIKGASGPKVKAILARYGETRRFVSEGGRTNRGLRGDIRSMLDAIGVSDLGSLDEAERTDIIDKLQRFLVDKVREWHNRQRLRVEYSPAKSTRAIIKDLLKTARDSGKGGQVAQYLVGAKLEQRLRHAGVTVSNESYSTADVQLNRQGDFLIGDTVFHVTLAPAPPLYEKCKWNLDNGYRVFLLVPEDVVVGVRQNADATASGRIAVEAIESFVGQNIEEMSNFSAEKLRQEFLELLNTYNRRVDAVEIDKSVMIEIPPSLER